MKSSNPKATNTPPTPPSNAIWGLFTLSENQVVGTSIPLFEGFSPTSIQSAIDSNCTHFAVVNASKAFKTPPNLTHTTDTNPRAWALSDYKQERFIKRFLLGQDQALEQTHTIVLNKAALVRLMQYPHKCQNLSELIYLVKKAIIPINFQFGATEIKKNPSFLTVRKNGISQFSSYFLQANSNAHKWIFLSIALLGFFHITQISQQAGISGDEFIQHEYGRVIANYHLEKLGMGMPLDTTALKGQKMTTLARELPNLGADIATIEDPEKLMHLYGSSFDTFTSLLIHWFNIENYMEFRHFWNAIFGWLIFVFVALIARRVTNGSWLWATVAFILCYFTPRIFGEALNNPKDIPFALGYVMSLYYAMKVFHNFPNYRAWDIAGLTFGIALGISIRIGGLLFIGITGVYMGLKYIESIGLKTFLGFKWTQMRIWFSAFVLVSISAYILGVYVWPYGWKAPIDNPMKALSAFTDFQVSLRQLFEGVLYDSDNLPAYYLAKYVLITLPVGILAGILLFVLTTLLKPKNFNLEEFLLFFAAVFPIVYIYVQGSSVYGGLRHILFTLPSFVLLGTLGFYKLSQWLPKPNISGPGLALLPCILPIGFVLKNNNLSYMYFNETIGGIEGAYGNYELDYYLASLKPSANYLAEEVLSKNPKTNYKIVSYGMDQVKYYLRNYPNAQVGFTRFDDRSEKTWDYAIFYNAYMDKHRLQNGYYPPTGTVYAPEIDGKAVGCVIKRPSNLDFEGINALTKENNSDKAIAILKQYQQIDSISSEVFFYLANAYANKNMDDSALYYAQKSSHVFKENSRTLFLQYQIYLKKNKPEEAVAVMDSYIMSRPKDPDGYIMKAQGQLYTKAYYAAIETVQKAIPFNPFDARIYQLGSQCYQQLKDKNNAQLWYQAAVLNQAKTQQDQSQSIQSIQTIYLNATGETMDLDKYFKQ